MFWQLDHDRNLTAVVDAENDRSITYGQLADLADASAEPLGSERSLVIIYSDESAASIVAYLGALRAGHVPWLADARLLPVARVDVEKTYRPQYRWTAEDGWARCEREPTELAEELCLLLSTSGSTGDPKGVRLSKTALARNASAIAEYLGLGPGERAPTTLPLGYSYGLSVVNSHLHAGATVVATPASLVSAPFWEAFERYQCTSIAGVPESYRMLLRLGVADMQLPSLRYFTQAGGGLDRKTLAQLAELFSARQWPLWVMYGQTEATARIAYLDPELLATKLGSIGRAIPGGRLWIDPDEDGDPELVYAGPNVMMGYARSASDLAIPDQLGGTLRTGDLAEVDEDGIYWIRGRKSRFAKIHGQRINLQWLEHLAREASGCKCAAVERDRRIAIAVEQAAQADLERCREQLRARFVAVARALDIVAVDAIPRLPSDKVDYPRLLALLP